jgi:8-oxo-dGTP pyrophosphatase MutT (NUDIX family)
LSDNAAIKARIAANLGAFPRRDIDLTGRRHAAVAVLLSPVVGEMTYVITRRALTLRRNAGNWALPGGHVDEGEDAEAAALRETHEELGVLLPRSAVVGRLDDLATLSGHVMTPVVLWSDVALELAPNPAEVQFALRPPISELDHPDAPMIEENPAGGPPLKRMFVQGTWVNPPTAAVLYQFREVCLHARWARTDDIGQPSWTAG